MIYDLFPLLACQIRSCAPQACRAVVPGLSSIFHHIV